MNLKLARCLAIALMSKHDLRHEPNFATGYDHFWGFDFDSAKNRFGICKTTERKITISKSITEMNDIRHVRDTLLHEIAHAIAYERYGRKQGHNYRWEQIAKSIGCDGQRLYDSAAVLSPVGKWKATCPKCGLVHYRHRQASRKISCGKCSRVFDPNNLLIYTLNTDV